MMKMLKIKPTLQGAITSESERVLHTNKSNPSFFRHGMDGLAGLAIYCLDFNA